MTAGEIGTAIRGEGFAFSPAAATRALLDAAGLSDWDRFAASWDDLGLDTYMADGGRYRKRRHAAFAVADGTIARKPHQPHYQSRDYNPLNGGIARWFAPVLPAIAEGLALACRAARLCGDVRRARHARPACLARRGAPVPHRGTPRRGGPANA